MQKDVHNDLFEKSPAYDIETLIRQYGNDVLRTAYMYVKDIHLAEDIFSGCVYQGKPKAFDL